MRITSTTKTLFFLLLITAHDAAATSRWTAAGTITGVYVDTREAQKRVIFRHSIARSGDNCSNNGDYYELQMDKAFGDQAYALLLSSQAQQQEVLLYLEGCSPTGFPVVTIISTITS